MEAFYAVSASSQERKRIKKLVFKNCMFANTVSIPHVALSNCLCISHTMEFVFFAEVFLALLNFLMSPRYLFI